MNWSYVNTETWIKSKLREMSFCWGTSIKRILKVQLLDTFKTRIPTAAQLLRKNKFIISPARKHRADDNGEKKKHFKILSK